METERILIFGKLEQSRAMTDLGHELKERGAVVEYGFDGDEEDFATAALDRVLVLRQPGTELSDGAKSLIRSLVEHNVEFANYTIDSDENECSE